MQTAVVRHDLWILTNESTVYDTIQQCLGGDALDTWVEIFVNKDKASWTTYLEEYVERLIGKDAYENQRDYIKEVKKPKDMNVRKWLLQIKIMNTCLPFLLNSGKGNTFSERELVKIIGKNIS